MKTVSLYSVKGGVGKSTMAVNLATLAAQSGSRVLLLDLDTQGAGSFYLNVESTEKGKVKALVSGKDSVNSQIRASDIKNLDVLPARKGLRNLDLELDEHSGGFVPLLKVLKSQYDVVVVDSPPQIGLTGEAIFQISDHILVPVIPTPLSIRTLEFLHTFFKKNKLDSSIILPFFSLVDSRKKLHKDLMTQTRATNPNCLTSWIPQAVEFEKMGVAQAPLVQIQPKGRGGLAIRELFDELVQKGVF